MDVFRSYPGWIEVIAGSMFSGKSEELIRRLRRAQIARQRVQIFKPVIDGRYSREHIVSHSDMRIDAELVEGAGGILEKLGDRTEVIGVDEGQFFDNDLVEVCNQMAYTGKRVIVAGLDTDYLGNPFEPMLLQATSEAVTTTQKIRVGILTVAACKHNRPNTRISAVGFGCHIHLRNGSQSSTGMMADLAGSRYCSTALVDP